MDPDTSKVLWRVTQNIFLFLIYLIKIIIMKELSLNCKHKLLRMFNDPMPDVYFFCPYKVIQRLT